MSPYYYDMPRDGRAPEPELSSQAARDEQFRLKVKSLIIAREELLRRNEELRAKNAALEQTIRELYEMLKPEDRGQKPAVRRDERRDGARDALSDFGDLYGDDLPPEGETKPATAEARADRLENQLDALLNLMAAAMEKNKRQSAGDARQLIDDMLGDIARRP
jgi:hypothetical protein